MPEVESARVMESEAEPRKLTTLTALSTRLRVSEAEKLNELTASSTRLRVSEALPAYKFPAAATRPLNGAAENGEKPNFG